MPLSPDQLQAASTGATLFELPLQGLILQADCLPRWINSMFTNKYSDVEPGQGRRSVIADDRGRVGGLVDWYRLSEERYLGLLEGVDTAAFLTRFQMYLVLEDIEPEELEDMGLLSLQGPQADAVLASAGLPLPADDHAHLEDAAGVRVLRRDRSGLGGVDLLLPQGQVEGLRERLIAGAAAGSAELLEALRIQAGKAAWPKDGSEKSMVHELNLQRECVSFDKGCYLGQEVINRIERVGGVRKRLTRLSVDGPVAEGATLWAGEDELFPEDFVLKLRVEVGLAVAGEDEVGRLSSVVQVGEQSLALGTVRESAWAEGTLLRARDSEQERQARVLG
mgnify:CR=1 FL=1